MTFLAIARMACFREAVYRFERLFSALSAAHLGTTLSLVGVGFTLFSLTARAR
jgi:hypothetical protein